MYQKIGVMIYIKHILYTRKNLVTEPQLKVLLVVKENYNMNKYLIFQLVYKIFLKRFNFQEVKDNPTNYDAWFDYIKLVESEGKLEIIRDTYERAVANIPPSNVILFFIIYVMKD